MRIVNLHHPAFVATFRKLGHDVLAIGTTPDNDVHLTEPLSCKRFLDLLAARSMRPDLILWCDACQPPWIFGFEQLPAVTIGYSVDQYMNPWHIPYSAAFDACFVAQKDYLPLFAASPTNRPAEWMPLFCNPALDRDPGTPRDIPVAFVGTLTSFANPGRKPFLDAFRTQAPLFAKQGRYAPIFGRSRIVLNQSAAGELNFRLFQAMACGAAVLTESAHNGLTDLFTPGVDCLTYQRGDAAQAAAVANAALADPDALAAVAAAGKRNTLAHHTVIGRARRILDTAVHLARDGAPARRLAAMGGVQKAMHNAYAMLATDEGLPLSVGERQFFLDMARK
ncbi:glycosyltransferase family protein [Solidesulfovibrio sp.]